ncbi:hypothetical protein CBR_g51374 [Chara braunii]|uniref:Integrase catalytic domain-containing protein n=1 Tax=Chara braunii TaxID=69332 RepID=A0A388M8F8_CHABU|nr:hypothetical protein CBR_g51374 [Chara braunii]|eukprot:GBG90868.1 hypothetical protein CBR_g51374 [Chara braunii]
MVPDPQRPFVVTTDASQYGIGAVLAQQEGKKLRPIEYMSKKMPSKKLAKSTYERELYALYKALVQWRHYLLGSFFYLRTDHQTLKWIKTQPVLSDALKRWIEVIDQYDFKLDYLKGEHNKVADELSRTANYLGALISEFGLSEDVTPSLDEAYKEDPITMDIINKLQAKDKATTDEFVMVDGLLFLEKAGFKRLVVPSRETLRSLFLGECHDAMGHFGYKKTSANLVQRFWWPNMLDDVKKYVETCQVCQRDKPRTQAPLGLLKPLPIPVGPGQSISMDFMDTLVTSKNGKRHIFVIVDRFTKYARLIAMPETIRTEHVIKLLIDNWWMRTSPVLSDALKCWIEVIEQYDFEPQYLKGEYNKVVDALSRRPDFSGALITELGLADDVTRSLVEAYREDPFMVEIIHRLEAKDKMTFVEFELVNGLLFLEKVGNKRLCVPNRESLRSLFLGECHDATGHFGFKKTAANLLQRFWWPTMMKDAKLYVETCQVCQRDKPWTQAPLRFLKPLPNPERPGESLSMDFMDTLVTSKSGMRYIYVIVDRCSKYARLLAMPETAKTAYVIRLFKENWVRDFGLPKSIISDRDVRFTSDLWKAAAAEQGTQLQMTSRNHPEANGQEEQMNRAVQHLLTHYIKPNQVDWDEKLGLIANLYNNAVHSATGVSPNSLLLTFKPRLPLDFLLPEKQPTAAPGTLEFAYRYENHMQQAVEHMHKAQAAMIESENKHRRPSTFQVGDRVWVKASELGQEHGISL